MKRYKLIKRYPGSKETGTTVESVIPYDTGATVSRYRDALGKEYGWNEIENQPEYWEKVKEPQFKVGDWITRLPKNKFIARLTKIDGDEHYGTGVDYQGNYFENEYCGETSENDRLATPQEIETHLIAEAKKRGYTEGTKYYDKYWKTQQTWTKYATARYRPDEDKLGDGFGGCIYRDGVWAEIVKEEEITVNGYKLKDDGNGKFSFGCANFNKAQIVHILDFNNSKTSNRKIESITLDSGIILKIDIIQKIHNRIK